MEYAYNEENQVSQKSEFAGNIRQNTYYRYDDFHRRTQVGTSSTWWKYTYDTLGRVATQRFTVSGADILTETVTYNNANQVQSIQKVTPENTRTHSYTYDANGNIATVTVGNKTIRYTYDTAGQLIREDNTSTYLTTVWTYDNAGNILSEKVYPYTIREPYELLEANSYTYGNSNWGDLLTAYNGQPITYDQIGNPLTYNNGTAWTFTWEHGRQLATMSDGTTWTNTYNSDGLRTSRTNGTTTYNYYYDGSQLTSVTGSNGNIWIFYDANRPVIIKYGDTTTYHYELNLQGDVIAILDSFGNRVVEYTYDAWGKILSISGSMKDTLGQANPLRYRGYVYDNETGLYYLQSRYYDPQTRRFLNSDIVYDTDAGLQGYNLFIYCGNNPKNRIDASGFDSEDDDTAFDSTPEEEALLLGSGGKGGTGYGAKGGIGDSGIGYNKGGSTGSDNSTPSGIGFSTFKELKGYLGSAGKGNHWHHIVEQCQIARSGFAPEQIHNTANIISVDQATHAKITGYYNTKTFEFTGGLSVRDYLIGQPFDQQFLFGLYVLQKLGVF